LFQNHPQGWFCVVVKNKRFLRYLKYLVVFVYMPTPVSLLKSQPCIACEDDSVVVMTQSQIAQHQDQIPEWEVFDEEKVSKIKRTFAFDDFVAAVSFLNQITDLAEIHGHHPDMLVHSYKLLTITLYTHNIKGVSKNDLIMAAKIDEMWDLRNQFLF
jgi:4a-hydroxytetrahydrobiopterin dehydratase